MSIARYLLVKGSEILGDRYFLKIEGILSFASTSENLIFRKDWTKKENNAFVLLVSHGCNWVGELGMWNNTQAKLSQNLSFYIFFLT